MSLAVRVPVEQGCAWLDAQALGVRTVALAGALASLSLLFGQSPWWAWMAAALPLVRLGRRWRAGAGAGPGPDGSTRPTDLHGWLLIDDEGRAGWQTRTDGPPSDGAGPWPLEPTSWDVGQQVVSLRGRLSLFQPAPALAQRPVLDLVFTRDALSADQWRGLRVWLLWRQRGGVPGRAL